MIMIAIIVIIVVIMVVLVVCTVTDKNSSFIIWLYIYWRNLCNNSE
jgi:hypothetical protein